MTQQPTESEHIIAMRELFRKGTCPVCKSNSCAPHPILYPSSTQLDDKSPIEVGLRCPQCNHIIFTDKNGGYAGYGE